jgi:hypothetical protein
VDAGESLAEAAVREVLEETGLSIRLTRIVGTYSRVSSNEGGGHVVLFAAEPTGGEARPDLAETLQVRWFPFDCLPERLLGMHRIEIQDAIRMDQAVSRRMLAYPTLARVSRAELYQLRDQGKLDLDDFIAELCAPLDEIDCRNELG